MATRTARILTAFLATAAVTAGLVAGASGASADLAKPTSTVARHVDRNPSPTPLLTSMSTGRHETFDRIVLVLRGAAPGYDVRYVAHPTYDPSGRPVSLPGSAYLQVVLRPAVAHTASGQRSYSGSSRLAPALPTLKGVVVNGDFEGVVSIALGLSKKAGFRVMTLSSPTRIVIDVAH